MQKFPTFELEKWILRGFENGDIDLVKEASQDPLIPYITSIPSDFSKTSALEYIERQKQRHITGKGYSFAIADIKTNSAIGSIFLGFHNIDEGRVSLGYWLIEEFRGQKIIGHVLPALIEWAFKSLEIQRLELYVEPWNIASIKTAQSLGFQKESLMRSWQKIGAKRKDMLMMSLIITEY